MSATDELRRLLDERGVKYRDYFHADKTWWSGRENVGWYAENRPSANGLYVMIEAVLTPAQAIAATLGDAPRLPHFWTHDGTLHIELPKLPESISVRLPDQRDRDVGSARTWQYTLGSGTCKAVYLLMATDIGDGREEVLGAYATESAAMKAISENQFGYALHHMRKLEVDE